MCNPTAAAIELKHGHNNHTEKSSIMSKIWPLPTPIVIALLPFLPQSFYLNRGYTVWFHLTSIVYFLTRSPFIRKILILQGLGICLGWYTAIAYDWFVEGTFCHTLYRNMPGSMLPYMLEELDGDGHGSYIIYNTYSSYAMKVVSHVLDTIGHPGLAYLFYKLHTKHWGGSWRKDILTWPIIVSSWHFSRAWSLVQSYYNTGTMRFWYYGHDVYLLNDMNTYLIAYVAEGVCFGVAILCRLYWDRCGAEDEQLLESQSSVLLSSALPPVLEEQSYYNESNSTERTKKGMLPKLIHSESGVSTTSMM